MAASIRSEGVVITSPVIENENCAYYGYDGAGKHTSEVACRWACRFPRDGLGVVFQKLF
jgi:hypothetical protein